MNCPECRRELSEDMLGCPCGWRTLRFRVRSWLEASSTICYAIVGLMALGLVLKMMYRLFMLGWRLL